MILDEAERTYLKSLTDNPKWNAILDKLKRFTPPPRYKPGDSDAFHKWIYVSGGHAAIEGMIGILQGREITLDYEEENERNSRG